MKVYIAGKITGDPDYKRKFREARSLLQKRGHKILDSSILPEGFGYEDYMKICFAMIDVCDAVCLLGDWQDSPGAKREYEYAKNKEKIMLRHLPINI